MSQNESNVRTRVADIFRAKERYLEEKRRREEAAERARRAHAEVFRDIVAACALPVFETVGESLAGYGLEHRIKVAGVLENGRFEPEQHATFEFRVAEDAAAGGPLLGRAHLRLSTDLESKRFRMHAEIAGGPDTPFAESWSRTQEVDLADLDAPCVEDAVLDLVERAVRSTYRDPGHAAAGEPRASGTHTQDAHAREPRHEEASAGAPRAAEPVAARAPIGN